ncbi:hypothetical protein AB0F68_06880 [Micromonospora sp. NPDC023966]|uniref:hypothetical protein n=1 Tax=Micromonospora sp. NPDC023966 TaxID=3154699 RepID=UPI0033F63C75
MDVFAELTKPDERTLRFTSMGLSLGGLLHQDDALAFQRSQIAGAVLTDAVPVDLRKSFERLRYQHSLGVVDYEQFTVVADAAVGLYEPALRARFIEFYRGQAIPFTDGEGRLQPVTSDSYDDIAKHLRQRKLRLPDGSGEPRPFGGMLTDLLAWARQHRLLRGQRARQGENAIVKMRNYLAHARPHHIHTPVDATLELRALAEFINQLWGVATVGGRCYPAPVRCETLAVGWNPTTGVQEFTRAENLTPDEDPTTRWILYRGVLDGYEAERFDSRYVTTRVPTQYLWGPGAAADAVAWLATHHPASDEIDPIDGLYLVRHHGNHLYLPQTPQVFAATPSKQRPGRWHLLRADVGNDAFACVRARVSPNENHNSCRCPVERLARGTWNRVHTELRQIQPTLVPHLPADVRAPSPMRWPRAVEIPA